MNVVLDTNVIVSRFISEKGAPGRTLDLWEAGAFTLIVSKAVLAEYQRVMKYGSLRGRLRASAAEIEGQMSGIRKFGLIVQPTERITGISDDPKDDKFLECALAGGADYIVSGDSHLLALREYRGIRILSPAVFLAVLEYEGR